MVRVILHIFLQTVLEMLPVSSSGNVFLFLSLLFGQESNLIVLQKQHVLDLLLHGLTVLVIGLYFFKQWFSYLVGCVKLQKKYLKLALFCMVADLITTGCYFLLLKTGTGFFPLWLGFLISGCLLFSLRWSLDTSYYAKASKDTRDERKGVSRYNFLSDLRKSLEMSGGGGCVECRSEMSRDEEKLCCQSCHPEYFDMKTTQYKFRSPRVVQPCWTVSRGWIQNNLVKSQKGKLNNSGDADSWILTPNRLRMTHVNNCGEHECLKCNQKLRSPRVIPQRGIVSRGQLFHFIILGTVQGLALLPGISRFGSTFVVARWLGFESADAFELSFLLAWPLMLSGFLKGVWQAGSVGLQTELLNPVVLCSIVAATLLSWFVLQWVTVLIARKRLWTFSGWLWIMAMVAWLSL